MRYEGLGTRATGRVRIGDEGLEIRDEGRGIKGEGIRDEGLGMMV